MCTDSIQQKNTIVNFGGEKRTQISETTLRLNFGNTGERERSYLFFLRCVTVRTNWVADLLQIMLFFDRFFIISNETTEHRNSSTVSFHWSRPIERYRPDRARHGIARISFRFWCLGFGTGIGMSYDNLGKKRNLNMILDTQFACKWFWFVCFRGVGEDLWA